MTKVHVTITRVDTAERLTAHLAQELDNAVSDWLTQEEEALRPLTPNQRRSLTAGAINRLTHSLFDVPAVTKTEEVDESGAVLLMETWYERWWRLTNEAHIASSEARGYMPNTSSLGRSSALNYAVTRACQIPYAILIDDLQQARNLMTTEDYYGNAYFEAMNRAIEIIQGEY